MLIFSLKLSILIYKQQYAYLHNEYVYSNRCIYATVDYVLITVAVVKEQSLNIPYGHVYLVRHTKQELQMQVSYGNGYFCIPSEMTIITIYIGGCHELYFRADFNSNVLLSLRGGGGIRAKVDSTTDLDYMYFSEINTIC